MGTSTFALGYAEGLGGLFAVAAAHKLLVLSRGRASEEALLQVTARRIKAARSSSRELRRQRPALRLLSFPTLGSDLVSQ